MPYVDKDADLNSVWLWVLATMFAVALPIALVYTDQQNKHPECVDNLERAAAGILVDTSDDRPIQDCRKK